MAQRLVVIGSNSFSGSHFCDYALKNGYDVLGISRSLEPEVAFRPYAWNGDASAFRFECLDLNLDLDRIDAAIKAFRPHAVVNFAAQSMVAESWQHPQHWMQTNVVATIGLHDRLRRMDFLERYIHVSTPEVYGHCSGTVREHTDYAPSTPYAVSRAAADMSLMTFFQRHGFPVVFTRAANVYGPGQQLYRIVPKTILCALSGRKLPLHGGGHAERSFIHIKDVVAGTLLLTRQGQPGQIYHLATRDIISIRDLVRQIVERLGIAFENAVEVVDDRPGKDQAYRLDTAKVRAELNWEDQIPLSDGIDETIAWVRQYWDALRHMPWEYIHKP